MKKIKLSFVCKANEERSPMAEAMANEYIRKNSLQDQIEVASAGVYVDHIQRILRTEDMYDNLLPNLLKVFVTEKGLENGIFNEDQEKQVKFLLTKGNFNQVELNKLYLIAKKEAMNRTKRIFLPLLEKKNLRIKYYHPEHLLPNDHDFVITLMDDEAVEVRKTFYGTRYDPLIETFHTFIGEKQECPIVVTSKDPLLYESLYTYMESHMPTLMNKLLKEGVY